MPKRKDKDPMEFYKGQLREKDKLIRSLERRIKELEKHQHCQETEYTNDTEDTFKPLPKTCSTCGKGKIEIIDIIGRIFERCDLCGERKKVSGP